MERVEVPVLRCYRCGASWTPRRPVVRLCPRCKSPYWDEPRIRIPVGGDGLGISDLLGPKLPQVREIARRYGACDLRVFGSVARSAARPNSDVDLLVEFRGRWRGGKSRLHRMRRELEALLGRGVDLVEERTLHWLIEPQIIAEAVPL